MTITHTHSYGRYRVSDSEHDLSYITHDSELYDDFESEEGGRIAWSNLKVKAAAAILDLEYRLAYEGLCQTEEAIISDKIQALKEAYE